MDKQSVYHLNLTAIKNFFCSGLSLFFLAFALVGFCLSAPAYSKDEPIKIGLMCALTGPFASEGQDMRNVVQILADELNKKGGINGQKVEIIVEDDAGDPRSAALAAQRLSTKGVSAVIGTYGSAVTEASQNIYDESEIVQIATGSTAIRLTEKNLPLFFRTCPRDDDQGAVAAKVLKNKGYKKVAILHDNSSFAKGLAESAKPEIEKAGIEIVFYDAITPGERDYTTMLTKLKSIDPDAIFFTGYYNEAGTMLRQMMEMKWKVPFIGGDGANNTDLVKIAGKDAAKGYAFLSPPMPQDLDSQDAKEFISAYKAKYNALPSSIWSVLAGDAFKVIVEGIKAKGTNSKELAAYLHNELKNYQGLTGPISFSEKGDRIGDFYRLYEVNADGVFILQPPL
ncbi:branched-chain amino acid ABC transporter substrate-binding protein [Desulfovibrio litoralis]|uniref:Amino acid/amide ABC transporter substrate-binding protein, HAAT family n=1 Tax=Desulfovibrio litoralis DSM 11393 TaxID=1121455 RepID=A0A1M7T655_9BACT|nr:branched-chain amino acid ABC transporter substrate-binding protein [Desulfovibrio litoralis]SHN66196.1 amino acid/amide ABC transporter substrate-binding protein, HAAT family [Desulfovibrio litoralis DSM 11393]